MGHWAVTSLIGGSDKAISAGEQSLSREVALNLTGQDGPIFPTPQPKKLFKAAY